MTDPDSRLEQMLSRLRSRKFRITPQRLAVVKILAVSDDHPSVEGIYAQVKKDFPTTSLATVYKAIALLKEMGEVLELGFGHEGCHYDGKHPDPHPHLICVRCRKIIDPDLESLKDMTAEVADETGFDILTHRLDFFGICRECQREGKPVSADRKV
ncbi:MAG: Fur family transcriptional regulator [Thermodesulfobacteriota bacterium]